MPQPTISGTPPICRFGGLALPGGAGTMAQVNLNDGTNWQWQAFQGDDDYPQISVGQLAWRAKSSVIGRDRKARILTLPMWYQEASAAPAASLGAQTAPLLEAGLQRLTFDGVTYILAELQAIKKRTMQRRFSPYYWSFDLEFLCPEPQFRDLSATSVPSTTIVNQPTAAPSGAVAAGGSLAIGTYTGLQYTYVTSSGETATSPASGNIVLTTGNQQISVSAVTLPSWATAVRWYFAPGSPTVGFTVQNNGAAFTLNTAGSTAAPPASTPATSFSVAYAGSVFAEPVWTFTVPNTNAAPIQAFSLANTMSGETVTILFPGNLTASTAWTITIDCGALSVTDAGGRSYDLGGSFPNLYPPAGQVNTFAATVTPASGVAVGCTIAGSVTNRWLL